ncbi:MAG: efflux RND transporter periplasmic adaptor subunit [Gammaproteobacteria bacterium]|nr:efflux RND transporter periplasmic adaptor subunit [Gammaproteobacteria bacterium]
MNTYSSPRAWPRCAGAVLLGLLAVACGGPAEPVPATDRQAPGARATPVIAAEVETRAEETRVEAVGTSRAVRSVTLYPASDGEVIEVGFRPGERVEKGAELLRLEHRDQSLAVELARVRVADAERRLNRLRGMQASGAVTRADFDDAISALESARIELQRARVALDDRTMVAPFTGHVGISEIEPGDRVDTDTPVVTLDDRSALLVRFEIPEVLIGRLREGTPISVEPWTTRGNPSEGSVVDVDSRIDPQARTFVARARVDNAADRLRPGMSFRVRLVLKGQDYPVVPEVAVQWGGDGAYVWRIVDGRAERIGVRIVQRLQGRVLVDAPLAAGDQVVSEGVQRMREGMEVSFLADDPNAMAGRP